jgi:hypothetical protein
VIWRGCRPDRSLFYFLGKDTVQNNPRATIASFLVWQEGAQRGRHVLQTNKPTGNKQPDHCEPIENVAVKADSESAART